MPDTKTWWQSRTIWLQIVTMAFVLFGALGVLPRSVTQEDVLRVIMAIVAVVTILLRIFQSHAIATPARGAVQEAGARILSLGVAIALPLMLLGGLSGCATTESAARTTDRIERVEAAYRDAKAFADLLLPIFAPAQANRVRDAAVVVERALALARSAATLAEREAAIDAAEAAEVNFRIAAGA